MCILKNDFVVQLLKQIEVDDVVSSLNHIAVRLPHGNPVGIIPGQLIIVKEKHRSTTIGSCSGEITTLLSPEESSYQSAVRGGDASAGEPLLLWVPHSSINSEFSHLVSRLCSPSPPVKDLHEREGCSGPRKWEHATAVRISCIDKIRRSIISNGVRCIEVYLLDTQSTISFVFQHGGLTKFLEEMRNLTPMVQSSFSIDDFIVYGEPERERSMEDHASEGEELAEGGVPGNFRSSHLRALPGTSSTVENASVSTFHAGGRMYGNNHCYRDVQKALYHSSGESGIIVKGATKVGSVLSSFLGFPTKSQEEVSSNALSSSLLLKLWCTTPAAQDDGKLLNKDKVTFECVVPDEKQLPYIPNSDKLRRMGPKLTVDDWNRCFVGEERRMVAEEFENVKRIAYMGGIETDIRLEVWCHMLHAYGKGVYSTESQRQDIREEYKHKYEVLTQQWKSIFPEQEENFAAFREAKVAIEKDVMRTDRSHPAFTDPCGEKLYMLRNVLMAHVMLNFDISYCQGMSDVLSPIALLSNTEVEAFICFSCFFANRFKNCFQQDIMAGMEDCLESLRLLISFFVPPLFGHLKKVGADDMLFCLRWLLIFFKREFHLDDVMLLWDVILCCPYTDHFELFVAAALLEALAPQILELSLTCDGLLKFVNDASHQLDVSHVIVLGQEFYAEVGRRIVDLDAEAVAGSEGRPTLEEVLRVIRDNQN